MAHFYEISTQAPFVADRPCRGIGSTTSRTVWISGDLTDLEAIFAQEFSHPLPCPGELVPNGVMQW